MQNDLRVYAKAPAGSPAECDNQFTIYRTRSIDIFNISVRTVLHWSHASLKYGAPTEKFFFLCCDQRENYVDNNEKRSQLGLAV